MTIRKIKTRRRVSACVWIERSVVWAGKVVVWGKHELQTLAPLLCSFL